MLPSKYKPEHVVAVVDTREQRPLDLAPMGTTRGTLQVGDYSIKGLENVIAIERKSLPDFVACCGAERERFQRELNALRGWPISAVLCEFSWADLECGKWRSRLTSTQVLASTYSWIAQGHCLLFADDAKKASTICREILYYLARYRYRESYEFQKQMEADNV